MQLKLPFVLILFVIVQPALAQHTDKEYKKYPLWVQMIDNPNTNYFESIKAYQLYWAHHEHAERKENKMSTEKDKSQGHIPKLSEQKNYAPKRLANMQAMAYQCKRFEQWMRDVYPYV